MSFISSAILTVAGMYIIAAAYTYFNQDWIIFARAYQEPVKTASDIKGAVPFQVEVAEGITLDGVHIKGGGSEEHIVLVFAGNSQEALAVSEIIHHYLPSHDVVGVNYRGYARSEGRPSEEAILADALVTFDQLQEKFPNKRVVLYGHSLGSSVATYVAANRKVAGTMLVTPFDSMEALGQAKYPWLPVKLLVRHRFKSIEFAKEVSEPVSVLIAEKDVVVPKAHSDRLIESFKNKPLKVTVPSGHSDIFMHKGVKEYLEDSLKYFTEQRPE